MEDQDKPKEALQVFLQAWNEAANDLEKFLAAYYVARQQKNSMDSLKWLKLALQHATQVNNDTTNSALPNLYKRIAKCYQELGDAKNVKEYRELADYAKAEPTDQGPFYHGTRADLQIGDLLTPGGNSNYQDELVMNHIYFTGIVNGAGLAAALAKGDGAERVYMIEPIGSFENDPNVTDKKFPGNPTRSYRSTLPLKIIGEITEWARLTPQDIQKWKEKLDNSKGEIIN